MKTRPKREELLKIARQRKIDVIIVWRLDRWGRSVSDLIGTIRELTEIGVSFISLTEALDLTTPAGKAMAGMLAVFAEFERDILGLTGGKLRNCPTSYLTGNFSIADSYSSATSARAKSR